MICLPEDRSQNVPNPKYGELTYVAARNPEYRAGSVAIDSKLTPGFASKNL